MAEPPQILPKLAEFVYDGLGRLIRTWRSDQATPSPNTETEDYYYDGVRRIQEVVVAGEDAGYVRDYIWAPGYLDELICQVETDNSPTPQRREFYYLQDANYNVVGMLNSAGRMLRQYAYTSPAWPALSPKC